MKYLLRSSSHGNGVAVIDDVSRGMIVKTARDEAGMRRLNAEREGLDWYAGRADAQASRYAFFSPAYARLDIAKFSGDQPSYKSSFSRNVPALEAAIDHYLEIWPRSEYGPVHGDLTLDNVILTAGGARFFDWEHFSHTPHLWGFDILYCLLSALLLPVPEGRMPEKADYTRFIDLLFRLLDAGLSPELAEYPLSRYRRIFTTGACWQGIVQASPGKLFPLRYDELHVDIIDDYITRRIRHRRYDNFKKAAGQRAGGAL